jgi:DNA-binding response OmpR family regulator
MNILIADDEATSRRVLTTALTRLGHTAVVTTNGREAWQTIQQTHFPVVISDWMMPAWDGLTLCRAIRRRHSDNYTLILLLTARGGKTNYLDAMEAGADDFLEKPLDQDQLAARLKVAERILGLHLQVKQLRGLLPICAYCKRIRDEHNGWNEIEHYIAQRSDAEFSHGICSECAKTIVAKS